MALNFAASSLSQVSSSTTSPPQFLIPKHKCLFKLYPSSSFSCTKASARSEGAGSGVTEEDPLSFSGSLSSTRTQLDLLEQLTSTSSSADGYESDGSSGKITIREQLARLVGDRDDDFTISLGKKT
ncbi:unnamed protein product [Dovyalis caffra]|uniref:Uncharacterized protein n=1 Tax=Dovyalis caffra TaxID=77055 RepID=A0AAV1S714_9ROSI|nr:unnamed protein product [Dovyalis caffra]